VRELPCCVWNTPAKEVQDSTGHSVYLDSPRAGGQYSITGTAVETIKKLTTRERALLTTWLCNQRRAGIECPRITSDIVQNVKLLRSLTTTERIERALLYFSERLRIGDTVLFFPGTLFSDADRDASVLAALSECETKDELKAFMGLLVDMGLIIDTTRVIGRSEFTPTAGGWLRLDELVRRLPVSSQAFVAMWFHESMDAAYVAGIEPAIREMGYQSVRIDNKEHVNKIDDEIIAEIRRSKFLVADFTCEANKVRGGVYFEAGYAMALPIPVIWTCSKASIADLHFDTRQYNHIVWDTPQTLRKLLKARIGAVLGDGPLLIR
jgi:hypothetical protein